MWLFGVVNSEYAFWRCCPWTTWGSSLFYAFWRCCPWTGSPPCSFARPASESFRVAPFREGLAALPAFPKAESRFIAATCRLLRALRGVAFCAPFGVLPFARPSWCCLLRALQLSCLGCRLCAPFGVLPFARPSWCCLLRALHLSSVGCCLSRGAFRPSLRSCQLSRGLSPLLLRLSLLQSCFTNLVLSWWLVGPSYATLLKYRLAQLSSRPAEMRGLPRLSSLLFYPPRKKKTKLFL